MDEMDEGIEDLRELEDAVDGDALLGLDVLRDAMCAERAESTERVPRTGREGDELSVDTLLRR